MKKIRVLFICKKRSSYGISYGLLNSCRFLVNALEPMGIEAKIIEVTDNNDIDREVTAYQPTHVFIEALWVVPSKFEVLLPLHPTVKWFVRLHSNTPFLASEGISVEWLVDYFALSVRFPQFKVSCNAGKLIEDLKQTFGITTVYTPNIYMPKGGLDSAPTPVQPTDGVINIGCFGATRLLKNQLIQAMAAKAFARKIGRRLNLHINATSLPKFGEPDGDPILRNIKALFATSSDILTIHGWLEWTEFIKLVGTMDLGLQVSMSETFDIVAADFVYADVPIVGSKEIEWLDPEYMADTTDIDSIVNRLEYAWAGKNFGIQCANMEGLEEWNREATIVWKHLLNH